MTILTKGEIERQLTESAQAMRVIRETKAREREAFSLQEQETPQRPAVEPVKR